MLHTINTCQNSHWYLSILLSSCPASLNWRDLIHISFCSCVSFDLLRSLVSRLPCQSVFLFAVGGFANWVNVSSSCRKRATSNPGSADDLSHFHFAARHLIDVYSQPLPQTFTANSDTAPLTPANNLRYISSHPRSSHASFLSSLPGLCHSPWHEVGWYSKLFLLTTHRLRPQFPHCFLCWPPWLWFKLSISFLHRWGPETDLQSCHFSWSLSSAPLLAAERLQSASEPAAVLLWEHSTMMETLQALRS